MVWLILNSNDNSVSVIYELLLKAYGPQGWWPLLSRAGQPGVDSLGYHKGNYEFPKTDHDRFEICVGAILTQNTAWTNVLKALQSLVHSKVFSKKDMVKLTPEHLAGFIRSAGYHNQKAKKLLLFLKYEGPFSRDGLLGIWGIGPETADSMLLYAYKELVFVIDAYTKRIFSRIGLVSANANYDQMQSFFHKNLPNNVEVYQEFHALIVEHAKQHCSTKPLCGSCPLLSKCEFGKNLI